MKRNTLFTIALLAGMVVNTNAEKLYLASIESKNYELGYNFSYNSTFQYDTHDNLSQMNIYETDTKESLENKYDASFTFKYDNSDIPISARYEDSDGNTFDATFHDDETLVSATDTNEKYTLKYSDRWNGGLYEIISSTGEITYINKYVYAFYHTGFQIKQILVFDADDKLKGSWSLDYGEDGELTYAVFNWMYYEGEFTFPTLAYRFTYFDENEYPKNTELVFPEPSTFVNNMINVHDPIMYEMTTLSLDWIIQRILANQDSTKKILKRIRMIFGVSILNSSDEGYDMGWCDYELKYQTERPTAEVEAVAADEDVTPVYFNIQGMPVSNPTEGEVYIVRRGSKATKEVYSR